MGQSGLTEGGTTRPAASAASAWRGSVGVRRAVANAVTARARSAEFVSGPHPSTGRNAPTPVGAKGGNVAISEPELPATITPPMIRLLPMWLLVDGICARSVFIPRRPEPPRFAGLVSFGLQRFAHPRRSPPTRETLRPRRLLSVNQTSTGKFGAVGRRARHRPSLRAQRYRAINAGGAANF